MGRRKIEMKLVRDSSSRQVTFTKRRNGVFKKANELTTLCGAEVAVIAFSPGGKPFSYGQPGVDAVANRFLRRGSVRSKPDNINGTAIEKLSQELMNLMNESEAEKKKAEMLDERLKKMNLTCSGKLPLEGLNKDQLQKLKRSLEEMKEEVRESVKQLEASSGLMLLVQKAADDKESHSNNA
ncbi:agamous-like MADS-box protein AGL29 [Prosopis cineraria]|uniref:agamous-like MADS-box protein AGL29 n=1 Tax=Prosopis cineraria TaxID=364024 RepID=UPI00241082A5|nr:agamous-like MADS-box protein AGL29 [Prosopis cineraria]